MSIASRADKLIKRTKISFSLNNSLVSESIISYKRFASKADKIRKRHKKTRIFHLVKKKNNENFLQVIVDNILKDIDIADSSMILRIVLKILQEFN